MITERVPGLLSSALLVAIALLLLTACSSPTAEFVDAGQAYELETVSELQTTVARPQSMDSPVEDAGELRREALIDLRSQGEAASDLAEFVTRSLPDNGRSVPYYGEAATVDETSAWILLELWGPEGGVLDQTRLWVFDRDTGAILYSAAGR